jgi:hypothetical protein
VEEKVALHHHQMVVEEVEQVVLEKVKILMEVIQLHQ